MSKNTIILRLAEGGRHDCRRAGHLPPEPKIRNVHPADTRQRERRKDIEGANIEFELEEGGRIRRVERPVDRAVDMRRYEVRRIDCARKGGKGGELG